jgi:molybdopterin-guanine dinucleotide biosynthesis protein A
MGRDKALVAYRDRTLLCWVVEALSPIAVVGVVRRPGQAAVPFPTLLEPDSVEHHPLLGVAVALHQARTPLVLVAPTDVPFVTTAVWQALLARAPAVAVAGGVVQPLIAALPRELAARAASLAAAGAPARALVEGLAEVEVPAALLRDVDTPEDLAGLVSRA